MERETDLKAIVVAVELKRSRIDMEYELEEVKGLAEACNIEVIDFFTQKLDRVTPNYFIGNGKIEELKTVVSSNEVDMVIFDAELSPLQLSNLEEVLEVTVTDRTMLVLDIFASRAKTKEAMLQVELAQLKYMKPRNLAIGKSYDRQQGGVGPGAKGPGEKKIELDKRRMEEEISSIEKQLKGIEKQSANRRKRRIGSNMKIVSLVGYTNAGKSSLMNSVIRNTGGEIEKEVFEKDMLFATLDTHTRLVKLDDNKEFLLIDTVGFVSRLPHHLVNSFKSTLEDVVSADLLLHVVDLSSKDCLKHKQVTEDVLEDLGANEVNTIMVYNKIDKTARNTAEFKDNEIGISAKNDLNINELLNTIVYNLFSDYVVCEMVIPFEKGHDYNEIRENVKVISEEFLDTGYKIKSEMSSILYNKYSKYDVDKEG